MTTAQKQARVQVQEIPVEQLFVSAAETRKTVDQAALKELAASIALKGVQEPLLVRPIDLDCMSGEPLPGPAKAGDAYEIVAGQRRHAASKIAGKATCPCIVREMPDAEAAELRIISNLQREDLPPLEEALAFSALLDVAGATVETVAAKLAKSPSYVGRRLKLLDAIEPVREALQAGAIEVGHALELARLDEKQQIRHLSRLNCGYVTSSAEENRFALPEDEEFDEDEDAEVVFGEDEDGEAPERPEPGGAKHFQWKPTDASVAELRREIARTTLRVLSDAPFPLADEVPPMACTECPKRSGNAALLFDDCAQDTCLDRDCFDAKVKVWVKYELDQADRDKRKLLMLSEGFSSIRAAIPDNYVTVIDGQKRVACEHQEEAIWISGNQTGRRTTICRNPACKQHQSSRSVLRAPADPVKAKAERKKLLEKLKAEKKYRAALFQALAVAPIAFGMGMASDLNLEVCLYVIQHANSQHGGKLAEALGWAAEIFDWQKRKALQEKMQSLAPAERLRVALLAAYSGELAVHEYGPSLRPDNLERMAKLLSVEPKKIRSVCDPKTQVDPKVKRMSPKAAAKPAPAAKKTPILSAAAKKMRIADAKKRWATAKKAAKR